MDWSGGESQQQQPAGALPPFPRIWIGYLLGFATLIAEMIAISLHPELVKEPLLIPPLYLFLLNFIAYLIKPLHATWFHLIPIYDLYWVFK